MTEQVKAKKLLPIIQAIAEGKKIQFSFNHRDWIDADENNSDLKNICASIIVGGADYRIKPEENYNRIFEEELERDYGVSNKDFVYDYGNNAEKVKEKNYRPFKNCDELVCCYNEKAYTPIIAVSMNTKLYKLFRPNIWIKSKEYGTDNMITAFDGNNESIGGSCVFIQDIWIDMKELFDKFTFCDGSPCGVEDVL